MGDDSAMILSSPAFEMTHEITANMSIHALRLTCGMIFSKYAPQEESRLTHVLKHAMMNMMERIIFPPVPNTLPVTAESMSAPFVRSEEYDLSAIPIKAIAE